MKIELTDTDVGALITGVDMNRLSDDEWKEIYNAWLDRLVLVIRDQEFSIEQFLDQGRRFGRLKPHRVRRTRHPDYPELTQMGLGTKTVTGKVDDAVYNRGLNWHTDGPWDTEVCKATQLYALEIPSSGGDTLFANMYTAYDALSADLKRRLDGLSVEYVYGGRTRQGIGLLEPEDRDLPPAVYPVVRKHPETGRNSLFINPVHFLRFVGLPDKENDELASELFNQLAEPGAEYRHKWKAKDYVIWDNRCLLHAATGGYPINEKRIHWRATVMEK
ncbi:MAG TPA: TauD/TfdA family dioxygenase [Burkholderiaceae bacterium]|nr:TauD/TfdA family dioxygenase [Burkholderiaceae bacterium]